MSYLNLIHLIIIFLLFYIYSHGRDFEDHGFFNLLGILIICSATFSLLLPLNGFIYIFRKKNYFYLFIYLLIIANLILLYYCKIQKLLECNDWSKGLNNTYIENNINKYGCQIIFPKLCYDKILKNIVDITLLTNTNCSKRNRKSKEKLLKFSKSKYIKKDTNRIGFPLTNNYPICCLGNQKTKNDINVLRNYIKNNLLDMDDEKSINFLKKENLPEIEVDFTKNPFGEMRVNVNYNKKLSRERKKLEQNSKPYSENILIIYIDSVSRANSIRKLPKTMKFFEQFMSYNKSYKNKYSSGKYHSFQFFKYHSFRGITKSNYPRIFYGNKRGRNIVRITKYLKKNGYVTGLANDFCYKDNARTFHKMKIDEVYDHQMLICDPNKNHYNTMSIRCLYGKMNFEYLSEYAKQFFVKYKYNRKFFTIISNDGHEGTLQALKYNDEIIYKFLNYLYNEQLLKNSSILLLSDHGASMPFIYSLTDFYRIEISLPMFYIIVNERKNVDYKKQFQNLYLNQQTFITGYDIYNTIVHLIYGNKYIFLKDKSKIIDSPKSPFGISLFMKINQKKRSPKIYNLFY